MTNDTTSAPDLIRWPIATLDFEASGLVAGSYPIEVGLCVWRSPDAPPLGWSTLIHPPARWRDHGAWDVAAEVAHGLGLADLASGASPTEAVAMANTHMDGGEVAWCDGGAWDVHWMRALARVSGVRPLFGLGHMSVMIAAWPADALARMAAFLDANRPEHRAGPDAERLMRALAVGAGLVLGAAVEELPGGTDRDE